MTTVSISDPQTRALLLDIEGTTTPVEFVYQILFPYARAHAAQYLARDPQPTACREAVALLREEYAADAAAGDLAQDFTPDVILEYLHRLMDHDRKSRGLKALQGLIWQDGYRTGALHGQVYPDVAPAFDRWRRRGIGIYIYSSGSVLAQQLLFRSTNAGDLTSFLSGHYDTAVGPKMSPGSYRAIAERIGVEPPEILFVSDLVEELDAARASGVRTALCVRGGDPAAGSNGHPVIRSFEAIVE